MSDTSLPAKQGKLARLCRLILGDWLNFQLLASTGLVVGTGLYGVLAATPYDVQIITLTVVFAVMGVGWAVAGGLAGQLLIGYISFFGIGAYTNAILYTKFEISPWVNLAVGAALGGMVAFAAAAITIRAGLNEDYFGLFTVALSQVFKVLFLNWSFAGKATGVSISILETSLARMSFATKTPYLLIALGLLMAAILLSYMIQRGRFGRRLAAIRESPMAAESLGINVSLYRTYAIGISGSVAGCVGAFYAQFTTFVDPEKVFGLALNFEFLLPPVIGGRLSLIGPLFGAALLRPIKDLLRGWMGGEADALYLVVYGLMLIVGILLIPFGIAGYLQRWHAHLFGRNPGSQ